jgi:flavin-dependent dehydrogenase
MDLPDADIAIVGDGPAGCIIASLLAEDGWKVALLSTPRAARARACEVLSPPAVRAIGELLPDGLLDTPGVARQCAGIKSKWHSDSVLYQDYYGDSGLVIDRSLFDAGLRSAALGAGASVQRGFCLRSAELAAESVLLEGDADGHTWRLRAKFAVDASGRIASLTRRLGSTRIRFTRQLAFTARSPACSDVMQDVAWFNVESDREQWWTASVAPDGSREFVHYAQPPLAQQIRAGLSQQLRSTCFVGRLAPTGSDALRWTGGVDAGMCIARHVRGHRWAAIGDAALAFDPVSSQGIWNAVSTAASAATAISGFLNSGSVCGLDRYEFQLAATLSNHLRGLRRHLGMGMP